MFVFQDLRYALRLLARSRHSTILAILSLALGIGATTAIFSVVYAVLIDPYPYTAADRIGGFHLFDAKGRDNQVGYTMSEYIEVKSAAKSVESAIVTAQRSVTLTEQGLPEAIIQEDFSPNAFEFFGVPPLFGRTFSPKDTGDESKVEDVAVLSYLFWHRHFLGSRDILGKTIRLNDKFYTIIGVLPVRFTWEGADVYTPLAIHPANTPPRYRVVVRAKIGIPKQQLNSEFRSFHEKFAKTAPNYVFPDPPFRSVFESLNETILGQFANTLLVLLGAVGFLLLIACANVANLLLARASARRGEIAVRSALGAGSKRIFHQLLTESTLLSLTGGALGILFAYAGVKAVVALLPRNSVPDEAVISINIPVLCFAVTVSVLTGIFFGMAPAFQLVRQNHSAFLKDAGRSSASSVTNRLRDVLIVAEVALSLVLLTGAAFAASGLISLSRQKLGYDPNGVLTTYIPSPAGHYPQWSQRRTFFSDITERLRQIPSVESVAPTITGVPPYGGAPLQFDMAGLKEPMPVSVNVVGESYLAVMHIPLKSGRFFDNDDVSRPNPVAVVSEDFVKTYFTHNEDPVGRHFRVDIPLKNLPPGFVQSPHPPDSYEIVGVCGSARNAGLRQSPEPAVYLPLNEILSPGIWFTIRTTNPNPSAIHNDVRRAVSSVDSTQAINSINPLDYFLGRQKAYPRFATFLFGVFGGIALVLASIGIFGVVSYSVSRRTREFGIRMALGATRGSILRLVVSATVRVLLIGFILGTIASIVASRALAGKLEGISASSPLALLIVIAVLAITALTACTLPVRSATQIHPVEALRHE
jgi:predicted permease